MPEDQNELQSKEEDMAQALPAASSESQASESIQVQPPAERAQEESVLEPESSTEPAPEEQTEQSEPESPPESASTESDKTQPPVAAMLAADPRPVLEKQPYEFEQCTIQMAIQLLPHDGDAQGRQVLVGVRSHMDAPIIQILRSEELGALPPSLTALIEQLKSELPAREQAAKERAAKAQEEAQRKAQPVHVSSKRGKTATAKPEKAVAAAPQPSVLTDEQRAKAVAQVATDDKQQLAMF